MRKLLSLYVVTCALLIAAWQCFAQLPLTHGGLGAPAGGGAAPFALDGTPQCASGTTSALAIPAFSNSFGNGIVYVSTSLNGGPITSITGVTGVTFSARVQENASGTQYDELWSGKASSALSSQAATVNTTTSNFVTACIFSFSGSHFAAPFDGNAAIPAKGAVTCQFTTSNANDILVTEARPNSGSGNVFGTGWTTLNGTNFQMTGYQSVSSTQSGTNNFGSGNSSFTASTCDAIIQGP